MANGIQTVVFSQNQLADFQIINKATVSQEDQILTILEEVKIITGFTFDKLISKRNIQPGFYSVIYQISTEQSTGKPDSTDFISQHNLLINLNSAPNRPFSRWLITQLRSDKIIETNMDGSIIEYNSPKQINSVGQLISPASISLNSQFDMILANANKITGKAFNTLFKENKLNNKDGLYARVYTIANQKPIFNFSSQTFYENEYLTINIGRYPSLISHLWNITQWQGESLIMTFADGSSGIIEKRKLEPHWFSDYGSNFAKLKSQASKVSKQGFTEIIAEIRNNDVWARAYRTAGDTDNSKVLVITLIYENQNIKDKSWSFLSLDTSLVTSLNSDGSTTTYKSDK